MTAGSRRWRLSTDSWLPTRYSQLFVPPWGNRLAPASHGGFLQAVPGCLGTDFRESPVVSQGETCRPAGDKHRVQRPVHGDHPHSGQKRSAEARRSLRGDRSMTHPRSLVSIGRIGPRRWISEGSGDGRIDWSAVPGMDVRGVSLSGRPQPPHQQIGRGTARPAARRPPTIDPRTRQVV